MSTLAPPPPTTRASTLRLSEAARHLVIPEGIVSTGWPRIRRRLADMGVRFDAWQEGVSQVALGRDVTGRYAATVGGITMSIPRQVGKTYMVGALIIAMCLEYPGLRVVWTAHHLRTSTLTFQSMQALVKRPGVAPHLAASRNGGIRTANGEQEICFANGSIIMFGARAQGFGRGFAEIDVEVFDEAQILTEKALEDMLAATNQAKHEHGALLWFIGTPPRPTDPGEAFTNKRRRALKGKLKNGVYIECSADPDGDYDDPAQWLIANPSYPDRTPHEAMLRLRENLPSDDAWRREGMGVWDEFYASAPDVFGAGAWVSCSARREADDGSLWFGDVEPPSTPHAIGVAVAVDRDWASIAAAGRVDVVDAEGAESSRIYLAPVDRRPGVAWLVARVKQVQTAHGCAVLMDEKGPGKDLIPALENAGVEVTRLSLDECATACGALVDGVREGEVLHPGASELNEAVAGAAWRNVGGDRRMWGRAKSTADVSMLEAATFAFAHVGEAIEEIVPLMGWV